MITKDDVSDLQSHILRLVQCEKQVLLSDLDLKDAKAHLEHFLYLQQLNDKT